LLLIFANLLQAHYIKCRFIESTKIQQTQQKNIFNMEESKLLAPSKKIFLGVLIYVIAGLIYSVVDPYIAGLKKITELALSNNVHITIPLFPRIIKWIALAGIICGYVFTFMGLNDFKAVSAKSEAKAVGLIRLGYILFVIAAAINYIDVSFMNRSGTILATLAPVFLIMSYSKLKNAEVYKKNMKSGFSVLLLAAIITFVGEGLDFIPAIGSILRAICIVPALVITLIGWDKIKRGAVKA
jgi:hypothetical protein